VYHHSGDIQYLRSNRSQYFKPPRPARREERVFLQLITEYSAGTRHMAIVLSWAVIMQSQLRQEAFRQLLRALGVGTYVVYLPR
jgi:hypothetical protein